MKYLVPTYASFLRLQFSNLSPLPFYGTTTPKWRQSLSLASNPPYNLRSQRRLQHLVSEPTTMADDAPKKQTNPNDEVLAAIAALSDKFTKEFESLNLRVKALEERSVVQRGGDGIL